jgi:hypothetical protein
MAIQVGLGDWHQPGYWESCTNSLNQITNPATKFKAFDELTDRLLNATAFAVLKGVSKDPKYLKYGKDFSLGFPELRIVNDAHELINRCTQLSKDTMIKDLGRSDEVGTMCKSPLFYIEYKIYRVLAGILLSQNFSFMTQEGRSLHSLSKEMWNLQGYSHGSACPCTKTLEKFD